MKFIYPNVIFLKGELIYYGYISPLLVVWGVAFSNWLNIVKLTYLHMWLICLQNSFVGGAATVSKRILDGKFNFFSNKLNHVEIGF